MLKMLWFATKSIGRVRHLRIKTKPNQQAKEGAGQAACSVCMTGCWKASPYTEAHSPESLLTVGSNVPPCS